MPAETERQFFPARAGLSAGGAQKAIFYQFPLFPERIEKPARLPAQAFGGWQSEKQIKQQ
jgi:hypothetical protein